MAVVWAAGGYDDRQATRVHGLRAHFGQLGRGRVTSGIVKLAAALIAATIATLSAGATGATLVVGVLLIAGTTNLVNLLDVAPGRALKLGVCLAIPLLVA